MTSEKKKKMKEHERVAVHILDAYIQVFASPPPSAFYCIYYDNFFQLITAYERTTQKAMTFCFAFENVK